MRQRMGRNANLGEDFPLMQFPLAEKSSHSASGAPVLHFTPCRMFKFERL